MAKESLIQNDIYYKTLKLKYYKYSFPFFKKDPVVEFDTTLEITDICDKSNMKIHYCTLMNILQTHMLFRGIDDPFI